MRKFKKSKYEKEFSEHPKNNFVENYMGYDIYTYPNIIDETRYTFWYSGESEDYKSGLKSIEECWESIKRIENV